MPVPPPARHLIRTAAPALLFCSGMLALAACGEAGAPTKAEIQAVIQQRMQAANQETSNRTLGLFSGPYDVNDFSVTNAECTARDNGVYHCAVTAVTKKNTNTAELEFKKVNGSWTLVQP